MADKRLCIPLKDDQLTEIKVKAARAGLSMAEVGRRLYLGWLADHLRLPPGPGERWYYGAEGYSVKHWNSPE